MSVNVELLEQTMQHIIDHPDEWDQKTVFNSCGTPGCFIGWTMHFSGLTMQEACEMDVDACRWAANSLGIQYQEANTVFYSSNTLPMLQLMVKDLVNGTELKARAEYRQEAHPDA